MQLTRRQAEPRRHGAGLRGPLSIAAALEDAGEGVGRASLERGASGRGVAAGSARPAVAAVVDPAAVLARLMDLHGSVALARDLAALDRGGAEGAGPRGVGGPAGGVSAQAAEVRALVEARLAELAAAIDHTFDEPFQRRNRVPGPEEVHAVLEQAGGAAAGARARPPAAAASQIWEPFGELATRAIGRIRFEMRSLREEVAPALRASGPDAARLERLDAALATATQGGRERVIDRLIPALEARFVRQLREAAAALPGPARAEDVAAWFAPGGWIRGELERMRRVIEAVLSHEAGRLLALAEAVGAGAPAS